VSTIAQTDTPSYRDRKEIAIESAELLKASNPHSEVTVTGGDVEAFRVERGKLELAGKR
jgi:hypothetical protein